MPHPLNRTLQELFRCPHAIGLGIGEAVISGLTRLRSFSLDQTSVVPADVAPITRRGRVGAGPLLTWVADVVRRTRLASDVQARHGADGDCNRHATR